MYDFFDMLMLASAAQDVVDKLEEGEENAAAEFVKYILAIDVPCVSTPHYTLYTEENAVIRFAQIFLESNKRLGFADAIEMLVRHAEKFDYANTPMLTEAAVADAFQKVTALFPYNEKVIGKRPVEIMLIGEQHESRNGESTALFEPEGMEGSICIYQLRDICTGTPEHILLHELGHLMHMKATGSLTGVPVCLKTYLSQMGIDCSRLSAEQQREIFADTFMLAVISKYPELGVPIPGISGKALEVCYDFVHTFFAKNL